MPAQAGQRGGGGFGRLSERERERERERQGGCFITYMLCGDLGVGVRRFRSVKENSSFVARSST